MPIPALIIAGSHSGSGKTTVTLAILAALVRRGVRVQGFKVGPDFIDPGHHTAITGRPSRNLDTWLLDGEALARTFHRGTTGADLAVIEGVMGLFDGRSALDEAGSTADLARLWNLPVVLVVDARGLARSIAPLVRGFAGFDPAVRIAGVVANRVGGHRHYAEYLVPALRQGTAVEPLGFLQKDERLAIPSRHLGLVTAEDFSLQPGWVDALAEAAEESLDLDRIIGLAQDPKLAAVSAEPLAEKAPHPVRIAVARDRAFCFYYQDNLDLLRLAGAELVPFSPLHDRELPPGVELAYFGGGYPELCARELSENASMRASIRAFHKAGGAMYAECGGMMACCTELRDRAGETFPMWDLIPARVLMQARRAALGYVTATARRACRLGPPGTEIRGHEFHYSVLEPQAPLHYATHLVRDGQEPKPDGLAIGGLLAGYAHLHFGSCPGAVRSLVRGNAF